jgi:hypothetical protein
MCLEARWGFFSLDVPLTLPCRPMSSDHVARSGQWPAPSIIRPPPHAGADLASASPGRMDVSITIDVSGFEPSYRGCGHLFPIDSFRIRKRLYGEVESLFYQYSEETTNKFFHESARTLATVGTKSKVWQSIAQPDATQYTRAIKRAVRSAMPLYTPLHATSRLGHQDQFALSTTHLSFTKLFALFGSKMTDLAVALFLHCHSRYATAAFPNFPPLVAPYVPPWPVSRLTRSLGRPALSRA